MSKKHTEHYDFGDCLHIVNRGNNKQTTFFEEQDYNRFLVYAEKYLTRFSDIYSYCVLPNHFHFLIRIKSFNEINFPRDKKNELSYVTDQFRFFFASYAQYFNTKYKRTGKVFEQQFLRIPVETDDYFTKLIFYHNTNHIKHQVSKDLLGYPYSSLVEYKAKGKNWINKQYVFDWFGNKEKTLKAIDNYKGYTFDDFEYPNDDV